MIGRTIRTTCKRTNRVPSQISRKKKNLLENMYEHFSKNDNGRSVLVSQNDSKNLAKLPQLVDSVNEIGQTALKHLCFKWESWLENYRP